MVLCEWTDAEREFIAAFSRPHGNPERGVSDEAKHQVFQVRSNDPNRCGLDTTSFGFREPDQWRLLGQYIAKNEYLKTIILGELTDRCMPHLFSELPQCTNLVKLIVRQSYFGREGVEGMVPFLTTSCKLVDLTISNNARVDDECFRLIVGALNGGSVGSLSVVACDVTDINALRSCTFPQLKVLNLSRNRISTELSALEHLDTLEELRLDNNSIGLEQCIELTNLLRKTNTSLRELGLHSDKLCDESIEALAGALKHNSTLEVLGIASRDAPIGQRGYLALLGLLLDVSSIANTYSSNHTLVTVKLPLSAPNAEARHMKDRVNLALEINNRYRGRPGKTGQIKVVQSQLNSARRKSMCLIQGIEFASTGSILADIDSYLLPNVLALVGRDVGRNELFDVLVERADLMALVDRKPLLVDLLARKRAQVAALAAEADAVERRLVLLDSGVDGLPTAGGGDGLGAKRMRRAE